MRKPQRIYLVSVLTLAAGLVAYLFVARYRHGHFGPIGAVEKRTGSAEETGSERQKVGGRPPYPTEFTIDGDYLLTDPTVPPLTRAVALGDVARASRLLAAGAKVNTPDRYGETALMVAALREDLTAVRQLLAAGAAVNAQDANGLTALFSAGNVDIAKVLIEHGADVNATSRQGIRPLMEAARYSLPVVQLLIANGAAVNARDEGGQTALVGAILKWRPDIVRALVSAGADVKAKDNEGSTPLSLARRSHERLSLSRSESVGAVDEKRLTDSASVVRLLEQAGATQ
jgi:hypothetical protein